MSRPSVSRRRLLFNLSEALADHPSLKLQTLADCPYNAAAPLTISIISLVIAAWRARFMVSVSESITSLALLVAESIAVMRAACSAATDSSIAWKSCMTTYRGSMSWKISSAGCS